MKPNNPFDLTGRVALVTGAAAGIGASCVEALAHAGAKVLATDIDPEQGQKIVNDWKQQGLNVSFFKQDVTSESDWQAAVNQAVSEFDGLDIIVNNAGIYTGGTLVSNSLEQVQRVNKVNIDSIFLGMKYPAEVMKPGGAAGNGGSIINLSSVAGMIGIPGHTAYGASKGAVRLYTKHAAVEFSRLGYGIRVNSVHPGVIATAMGEQVFDDFVEVGLAPNVDAARELLFQMTPMGRLGTPEEVANMVLFLASDASSYSTGSEFVLDGGASAA